MADVDEPVDARLRMRPANRGSGRNGVDDVAQRAEPNDEDVQELLIRARRSRVE